MTRVEPNVSLLLPASSVSLDSSDQATSTKERDYWDYYTDSSIPWYERALAGAALPLAAVLQLTGCGYREIVEYKNVDDYCPDNDGDEYADAGCGGDDCDDGAFSVNPDAEEIPYDGIDQDCDNDDLTDLDEDGFDAEEAGGDDCDDADDDIYPFRLEECNGIDDNCDGAIDEGLETTTYYVDNDGDGQGDANAVGVDSCSSLGAGYVTNNRDCADADPDVYQGATEVCNHMDDDCDGVADEDVETTYYQDADGDNYGNPNVSTSACSAPAGFETDNDDCDDTNPDVHPGAEEIPDNGIDENCNGLEDEWTVNCDADSFPTIQEAVDVAIDSGADQSILICAGTYSETVSASLYSVGLDIQGESGTIITGGFDLGNLNDSISFNNLEFDGGYISAAGSGGSMSVDNCTFHNLIGNDAIYFSSGDSLTVSNTTIYNNEFGSCCGGAIEFGGNFLSIQNSSMHDNTAQQMVVGIWEGRAEVIDSYVEDNEAYLSSPYGAVFYLDDSANYLESINTVWDGNSPADVFMNFGDTYTAGSETDFYCSTSTGTCE